MWSGTIIPDIDNTMRKVTKLFVTILLFMKYTQFGSKFVNSYPTGSHISSHSTPISDSKLYQEIAPPQHMAKPTCNKLSSCKYSFVFPFLFQSNKQRFVCFSSTSHLMIHSWDLIEFSKELIKRSRMTRSISPSLFVIKNKIRLGVLRGEYSSLINWFYLQLNVLLSALFVRKVSRSPDSLFSW